MEFRCFFLNVDGKIEAAEELRAETVGDALELARAAFAQHDRFPAFELWQGAQRLHVEARVAA
jgi:hypothetical protein